MLYPFLLLFLAHSVNTKRRISDVYLLLPQTLHTPNARLVQYELQAFDGCYHWSTANSKIISLKETPGYLSSEEDPSPGPQPTLDCFSGAALSPVATVDNPPVVLITASDERTELKCEVKVGRIQRLEIFTTVKSYRVNDLQSLYAAAFDAEGNRFSSLEGLRFKWGVLDGSECLGISKFKDSLVKLSSSRLEIEHANYQSDVILVEGRATGVANVTLKIEEPGYEHVSLAWTQIWVSEPFDLLPSPQVFLPPRAMLQFSLFKISPESRYRSIELPSADYAWTSSTELFEVNNAGELFTSDVLGKGHVTVQDRKIVPNNLECEVNVVAPDRVILSVQPYTGSVESTQELTAKEFSELVNPPEAPQSNWNLISGEDYLLSVRLFWRNTEVQVPDNALFAIVFKDSSLWESKWVSRTGAKAVVTPRIPTHYQGSTLSTRVSAVFTKMTARTPSLQDWVPSPQISDSTEVTLLRRVFLLEHTLPVLLPYFAVLTQAPEKDNRRAQEYQLNYEGGSPALNWKSEDSEVVSVLSGGVIYAHRLGQTRITVSDSLNALSSDSVLVEVALVESLFFLQERTELVALSEADFEVAGRASDDRKFHNCSAIVLDWHLRQGSEVLELLMKRPNKADAGVCETRRFRGSGAGQAVALTELIHAPSPITQTQPEIRLMSEEGKIGVFVALSLGLVEEQFVESTTRTRTEISNTNAIVLAFGSSVTLSLTGGPSAWDDSPSSHLEEIEAPGPVSGRILGKTYQQMHRALELACPGSSAQRGADYSVLITVQNVQFAQLPHPGASSLELVLGCHPPAQLKLDWADPGALEWRSLPTRSDALKRHIPSKFQGLHWVVLNDQELLVNATVYDSSGRELSNFSSAELEWATDSPELVSFLRRTTPYNQHAVRIEKNEGGNVLSAQIRRMQDGSVLDNPVASALQNQVVQNVELAPATSSLYLHTANALELTVLHGSGYFEVSCSSTELVQYSYDGAKKITVYPKSPGRAQLQVIDVGLPGSVTAFAEVLVSPLAGLELRGGGLLPLNATTQLAVAALDSDGRPFPLTQLTLMHIELHFGDTHALKLHALDAQHAQWDATGLQTGEFQVQAAAKKHFNQENSVKSNTVVIDVFPPLEVVPRSVLLLPGAQYTLNYNGGPEPSKYLVYSIGLSWVASDPEVCTVNPTTGETHARKVGETRVVLRMVRKETVLTEAHGDIKVRLVHSVGVLGMGPARIVLKDSATRLIAVLYSQGEALTDAVSSVEYIWKSNSPTVYAIHLEDDSPLNKVAVTGLALNNGKSDVTLHVKIKYPDEYSSAVNEFSAQVTAAVDNALIAAPASHRCHSHLAFNCGEEYSRWLDSDVFLVPPHSSFKLTLNKEDKLNVKCFDCREGFVKVNDNGQVWAGEQYGETGVSLRTSRNRWDYHLVSIAVTDIAGIHIDRSHQCRNMALGTELDLHIIYQDSMARSFPAQFEYGVNAILEVSNSKVASASLENRNSTLKIRSQYVGDTTVKVYIAGKPTVKDIIHISVSSVMRPVSPITLHLGGEVQFQTTHKSPAGVTGTWAVEDSSVLSISRNGYIKSLQEGDTHVHYKENNMNLRSQVKVRKITGVRPGAGAPSAITNYEKHPNFRKEYRIPLELYTDANFLHKLPVPSEEEEQLVSQNIHVRCSSSTHSDWVHVESEIDKFEKERWSPGSYACLVTPNPESTSTSVAGSEIVIDILVSAKGKSLYNYYTKISLPFIPKFYIPGHEQHVVLSGRATSHTLVVGGTCGGLSVWNDPQLIVTKTEAENKCLVEITVQHTESDVKMKKVELLDTSTGQKQEILLSYYIDPSKTDLGRAFSFQDLLIIVAFGVLLFVLFFFFRNTENGQRRPAPLIPRAPGPVLANPRLHTPNVMHPPGPADQPGSSGQRKVGYGQIIS